VAVRARDDTGWDDLPGGLPFSDEGFDDDNGDEGTRHRGLRTAVWLLVLGVLLGGAGAWALRWTGEADVRAVLTSSTATYAGVLDRLREAPDVEALADAAEDAERAAQRLDDDLARLEGTSGERRSAVAAQVGAERDVLRAVAALGEVDAAPLRVWGDAHADLTAAVNREEQTRSALLLVDSTAAQQLPDTPGAVRRIAATVGEAVVGDVARAADDLLSALDAATRTADLREAAVRAEAQRTAVIAAGQGLGGGTDAAVLAAFGDALLAVAELRALTPDTPEVWESVRSRVQTSLRVVADADAGLDAGSVRGRLPLVLDAVDGLVARAEQAQTQWRIVHDAAVALQSADAATLRRYAERVREGAAGWTALRTDVEDAAQTGVAPEAVDDAWADADGLRLTLVTGAPPVGLQDVHDDLVAAVTAVATPLARARRDVDAAAETARAVDALAGWDSAFAAWESAVVAAETEVSTRALPPPPDV
jgi:hypothetical protein